MARIAHITEVAENTIEIGVDDANTAFIPGQFVELFLPTLGDGLDPRGKSREFSITSAPNELPLTLITRTSRSPYKEHLASLLPGSTVAVRGPFGRFILPESNPPDRFIFVASGVGIAPFLSMLRSAAKRERLLRPTMLLFKTKTRERAPYLAELEALCKTLSKFSLIVVPGEKLPTALAELAMNKSPLGEMPRTQFYMAGGPKPMRDAYETLRANGISPSDIFTEEFTGY